MLGFCVLEFGTLYVQRLHATLACKNVSVGVSGCFLEESVYQD